jgi:hypothetical protein
MLPPQTARQRRTNGTIWTTRLSLGAETRQLAELPSFSAVNNKLRHRCRSIVLVKVWFRHFVDPWRIMNGKIDGFIISLQAFRQSGRPEEKNV